MRGGLPLTLLITLMTTALFGQDAKSRPQILSFTAPDPSSPVPGEMLRKLAVQLGVLCKVADRPQPFTGTGFLVGVPSTPAEAHQSFEYLVTNRHVAECWDVANHPQEVLSTNVRLNTQGGGAVTLPLNGLDGSGKASWFFPTDESVDLAVTPVHLPDDLKPDVLLIAFDSFASRDSFRQHRIGEGSTVIVAGTFVQFPGERRFEPILRQGILSMVPDEPMKTTTGKPGTVYLADIHVFGGNSGSPAFAKPQDDITHMGDNWLIGVVSGYYYEKADAIMEVAITAKGEAAANSGVAMIVPADEVKKLIENNPELKRLRDAYQSAPKGHPSR
jgi:Trypsin-like peptidase domain